MPSSRAPQPPPVSVARGSVLFFASSIVGSAGFFVAALLLARGLGPAGRGSVAFITVTALVTSRIAKAGLGQATSVLAAQRPGARGVLLSNLLSFSLFSSLVVGGAVVGVLYVLDAGAAGLEQSQLAILLAGIVATSLVDDNFLIGCGRLREAAAISASGGWLYAVALVAAIATVGLSVDSAVVAWVAAHLTWATVLATVGARVGGLRPANLRLLAESVRFGVRAWLGGVSLLLNARLDQLLVGIIATDVALGLYAVAVNAAEMLLFLPTAIATSLLPTVAREHDGASAERTLRTFRAAAVLALATIVVAASLGWLAIPTVFGEDFRGSVEPFMWLLPGALGYTALSIFSNSLLGSRAPGMSSLGSAMALGVGLALDIALIPVFGASGAAAAASAAFLAGGAAAAVVYRSKTGFRWRDAVPTGEDVTFLRRVAERALRRGAEAA
ncbi:MAG TPA: oligosaccharide flippase family protein [Solirubrobacteraceae bacterium]|nr:oligosaccharide flippase family protein [Solirubrobacteraceae bacterium]